MERRSPRGLSSPKTDGKKQQPGDTPGNAETNDQSGDNTDEVIYVPSSNSDSDSSYEGEDNGGDLDSNQEPIQEERVMKCDPMVQQQVVDLKIREVENKKKARKRKVCLVREVLEEQQKKRIDRYLSEDTGSDDQSEVMNETAEASSDLTRPLLRYQKEWLHWALKQEKSAIRGGILADEMGMGKTVQAIALVLAKREIRQMRCGPVEPLPAPGSSEAFPPIKGTLVICPVVAVTQWASEIDRFTSKGSTKALVYHGRGRRKTGQCLSEYDFVITTYSIVEFEYREYMYMMAGAVRPAKQSKRGKKRMRDSDASEKRPLHAVCWERIILDEAHYIKSRNSSTTKAVLALESCYRWALSARPIQNSIGELYSLVRFLRMFPYSHYFCKRCNCWTLEHSTSQCFKCTHGSYSHFFWWKKHITKPLKSDLSDVRSRAMILLQRSVLKKVVLRRTKSGRAVDLALPPTIVSLRRDSLDIKERDFYQSIYNQSQAQFNTHVESNTLIDDYDHIFHLLTLLRLAVDHPYLVVYSQNAASRGESMDTSGNVEQVCGLCRDPVEVPVVTSCEHIFCKQCFSASFEQVSCPLCSELPTVDSTSNKNSEDQANETTIEGFRSSSILNRIQLEKFQTSTKIEALREEIRFMVERDGSAKGIVFSQFTSFLDLIYYSLHESGVSCVQLNGSMSLAARDDAIKKFNDDPDCKIFLMSLKAGGVALNLTVASHVFLMDPWWNPAVERQAQDRIHRIGQHKPIRIVKFVIENTIEERILKLQEKKELVFEGTLSGSSEALGKLTVEDFRFLFVT